MDYIQKIRCFSEIRVSVNRFNSEESVIDITIKDPDLSFQLIFKYDTDIQNSQNLAGLAGISAVINYSLFTGKIAVDFPTSENDRKFIREMARINNIEVFVNRLCRRRYEFFRPEYLPEEKDINQKNAEGNTEFIFTQSFQDQSSPAGKRVAVLSSGGKESLMTAGMMRELGENPLALFFNESGGHWKLALPSHRYFKENGIESVRVWSNIDRFYNFMNRNMKILDERAFRWADDYPVQLFTFTPYLISFLPAIIKNGIGNILMGNEFDDPVEEPPYMGIKHYYGVYDQSPDFQNTFTSYMESKGIACSLWSAVYAIYGCVVEDILVNRYPDLYRMQRSCHSCHYDKMGNVVPCGKCSKCLGVRLFIEYASGDPEEIFYGKADDIPDLAGRERLKLDPDELNLMMDGLQSKKFNKKTHVSGIHIIPGEKNALSQIPENFRERIGKIFSEYTSGCWSLDDGKWIKSKC